MASDAEMASYIADMLNPLGEVRIKRMFGEYCFYVNEKPVGFSRLWQLILAFSS